ncbi:hypothetical protein [Nonomuraea dietziae]
MLLASPLALVCGVVVLATRAARARGRQLHWGAILAVVGLAVLALTAWSTHEDVHYDDFGSAMIVLASIMGGGMLLCGLSPFVPWLLRTLGRHAARGPLLFRMATHDVADGRTVGAVATTMNATALAVTVMIVATAVTAQNRAEYYPEALPGALVVALYSADEVAARAAIQHALPGKPITRIDATVETLTADVPSADLGFAWPVLIGEQALLRYLTGDSSTPYDEGTAVAVTAENITADSVEIRYNRSGDPYHLESTKVLPGGVARPAGPGVEGIFIPSEMMRDLGLRLKPTTLIIDPTVHRTSAIEQERIERRLGDTAGVYVERGYQASTGWWYFVVAMAFVALAGAWAATGSAATRSRSRRVLMRVSGGSTATVRLFVACRTGFGAACGALMGAAAGYVIGRSLAWPMTASAAWEPIARVPFETPWAAITILVAGIPVLAAAIAAALPPGRTTRPGPAHPLVGPQTKKPQLS